MDWLLRYADPSIDWNYAMVTLVVRFIGVFIVMAVIQVALQAAARAVGFVETREARARAPKVTAEPVASLDISAIAEGEAALDAAAVAAIGLVLERESGARPTAAVPARPPAGPSPWAMAGRLQHLR